METANKTHLPGSKVEALEAGKKLLEMEPASQRHLELSYRRKWAERLLSHFVSKADEILHVAAVAGAEDPLKEFLHLFGDARFRAQGYTAPSWRP